MYDYFSFKFRQQNVIEKFKLHFPLIFLNMSDQEEESGFLEKDSEIKKETKETKSEKKPEKLKKKKALKEIEKLREKLDHLEKLMQTKEKALTEEISKYAFLQAELENMRKYYVKQQDLTRVHTKANVITSFTPLIDSFEMAFNNHTKIIEGTCSPQLEKYIKGFEGIRKQLSDIFESYQVKVIDTINIPFDYKEHEVMMRVLNDNLPEDTILQIVQKGYKMNGEVIRPAKVVVSKITPPPAPEPVKETTPEISPSEKESPQANSSDETIEGNQEVREKSTPNSPESTKTL